MNDLIRAKLKEIFEFKKGDLRCKSKRGKTYDFGK